MIVAQVRFAPVADCRQTNLITGRRVRQDFVIMGDAPKERLVGASRSIAISLDRSEGLQVSRELHD